MPRKNVPHKVDEIADAILNSIKNKKIPKKKKYDIAYGTAWKEYKKQKNTQSDIIFNYIKLANKLDDLGFFKISDKIVLKIQQL